MSVLLWTFAPAIVSGIAWVALSTRRRRNDPLHHLARLENARYVMSTWTTPPSPSTTTNRKCRFTRSHNAS